MKGFPRISSTVLAIAATCLLTACSGGDSSSSADDSSNRSSQTPVVSESPDTNGGTGSEDEDQSLVDDTSPEGMEELEDLVGGEMYYREAVYPKVVKLPLQFITTIYGRKLSASVTLPANEDGTPAEGPFPVILTQSAYNTSMLSLVFAAVPGNLLLGASDSFIVRRGYAQVAVDAMGTGASEGGWELLGADEQVGFADAVDWVHQQPWSNGKLGLAGVSYMAISSLFAAQTRPDSVDAIFASLPMGDAQRGTVGIGGMINAVFMSQWMFITHALSTQNIPTMLTNPQHMAQLIRTTDEHVAQIDNYHVPLINDALNGAPYVTYDSEFWRTRSPIENIDKVKAPTFFFTALDDLFQRDTPLMYEALKRNGVDTRMVVFNGTHIENFLVPHVGNAQVAPIDFLLLQWFDKYLMGMDTGTEALEPVVQHVKNYPTPSTPEQFRNDSYATTTEWPHPLAAPERWYLRGDMSLTKTVPDQDETGPVMTQPEHPVGSAYKNGALIEFDVHINDGTKCSRSYQQWVLGLAIPKDCFYNTENSEQQRLIFETAPMAEDYYINGPLQADIWISSTVTEAVVAVQIEEVSDKAAKPITNGQLLASGRAVNIERSRFLNGEMIQPYHYFLEETSQPLVPGEVVKMQVEIFSTSAVIRKGNKLRVSISPSNQAQAMLNYPRQAAAEGGVTTIHISPDYPSSVVMPIVPTSALN